MKYKRLLVFAVLAFVAFGGYYIASRWSQLSMTLSRSGSNVSASTSMELYEINLRRMEVDAEGQETGQVLEWKLAVPRAFLLDENGENGVSYTKSDYRATSYSFSLAMQVSEDLKEFTPRTQIKAKGKLPRDILIDVSNSHGSINGSSTGFVVAYDLCVREHERGVAAAKLGLKKSSPNCYEQSYRCSINAQIDGWEIGATVTKDLYSEPDKSCAIMKSFLNKFTVKRDVSSTNPKVTTP